MTEKLSDKGKIVTLSDADISSERTVSRRSLLGTIGLGAGIAAAAVLGTTTTAEARSDRRRCWRDSDPRDRITVYCDND